MASTLGNNTQSFNFISYTGSELKVTTEINGVKIVIGNLAQLAGQIKIDMVPRYVFGSANPVAASKGKRAIMGKMVFEVLNNSLITDIKNALKSAGVSLDGTLTQGNATTADASGTSFTNTGIEYQYEDQLPPMDIEIIAIKEDTAGVKSSRTIKGVVITSKSSAIGIKDIDIQEEYEFLATEITPLKRIDDTVVNLSNATAFTIN